MLRTKRPEDLSEERWADQEADPGQDRQGCGVFRGIFRRVRSRRRQGCVRGVRRLRLSAAFPAGHTVYTVH